LPASFDQSPLFGSQSDSTSPEPTPAPGSFEVSLAELEKIVHGLEEGGLGLAESLARYELGIAHLKHCYQVLNETEQRIQLVTGVLENGTSITQLLDDGVDRPPESLADSAGKRRTRRAKASGD
jgi:exodeoxyribonuclease VII small subunit